jgi:hypothetical protein
MDKTMKIILLIITLVTPSISHSSDWIAVDGGVVEIDLNEAAVEAELWRYIDKVSTRKFEPKSDYTHQYKAISTDIIKVHSMCSVVGIRDLHKWFVRIDDGGSCYFDFKYNIKSGVFSELYINGEA